MSHIDDLERENERLKRQVKKLEAAKQSLIGKVREWYLTARSLTQCFVSIDDENRWLAGEKSGRSPDHKTAFSHWLENHGPENFGLLCPRARFLRKFLARSHR